MSQDDGTNRLDWSYSAGGKLIGFKLNGTDCYYYLYNLQGDVTGIYDSDGVIVAKYFYDAWGNTTEMDGSGNAVYDETHIACINPIRYRSYYYDSEISMYYLQSRYYMPGLYRFISADALFVAGDPITGSNMFAYCGNNPVMYVDPSGFEQINFVLGLFYSAAYFAELINRGIPLEFIENNIELIAGGLTAFIDGTLKIAANAIGEFGYVMFDIGMNAFRFLFNGDKVKSFIFGYPLFDTGISMLIDQFIKTIDNEVKRISITGIFSIFIDAMEACLKLQSEDLIKTYPIISDSAELRSKLRESARLVLQNIWNQII